MFHKDTRRSDKFARSVEHFRKAGKDMPTRGGEKEIEFSGYTEFLKSKTTIGPFDIRPHMKKMKTYTHYYSYPNRFYSEPRLDLDEDDQDETEFKTEIIYEKERVIQCANKYRKENPTKNISILNFASAKNPGGGFLRGSMAQEESIAYVSTLYHSLIQSDMYKINNDLKIYFSKMCECVMWNLYDKPYDAYFNGKRITTKKLNEIIIPETYISKTLIVPCQRDSEYYENILLSPMKITYKELFIMLYNFYNKEKLDIKQIKQIPNDVSGYIKDAIKDSKKKSIYRIDLVGNLCRFEGVQQISENIFRLKLGS